MWTQITNEHLKQIIIGTLISEQNPNELETIYTVEKINDYVPEIGAITLRANHLTSPTNLAASRVVTKKRLVSECWWIDC